MVKYLLRKKLILKNKLESYKDEARNTQNKLNEILKDAIG